MLARSPYRGTPHRLVEGPLAVGIQTLGWDASLASVGNWIVAFHGYVGNWDDLARERSWTFPPAAGDAHRLAVAWEDLGEHVLPRLRGEWALLVWDRRERVLSVARDPVGLRPLFWKKGKEGYCLATEIRQVLAAERDSPEVVPRELAYWLAGPPSARAQTVVASVSRVLPARVVRFPERIHASHEGVQYWAGDTIGESSAPDTRDLAELVESLRITVERAVVESVPAGPFSVGLSGGVDSTVIWSILHHFLPRGELNRALAVSCVYPGMSCDERAEIEATHAHLGTTGVFVDVSRHRFPELAREVARVSDAPFHPMAFSLLPAIRAAAERGHRVHTIGLGPDEFLAGSLAFLVEELLAFCLLNAARDFFRVVAWSGRPFHMGRAVVKSLIRQIIPVARRFRPPEWLEESMVPWLAEQHSAWRTIVSREGPHLAELRSRLELYRSGKGTEPLEQIAASEEVELRFPLVTAPVVQEAMRIPSRSVTGGGRCSKYLLIQAFREVLPGHVLGGSKKVLFDEVIERDLPAGFLELGGSWRVADLGIVNAHSIDRARKRIYKCTQGKKDRITDAGGLAQLTVVERWLRQKF